MITAARPPSTLSTTFLRASANKGTPRGTLHYWVRAGQVRLPFVSVQQSTGRSWKMLQGSPWRIVPVDGQAPSTLMMQSLQTVTGYWNGSDSTRSPARVPKMVTSATTCAWNGVEPAAAAIVAIADGGM